MFWKYDDEEEKVVPREPEKKVTPSEVLEKSAEAEEEFLDSDETGAGERFEARVEGFKQESKPVFKHHVWWFIHNCIAHPMIGLAPCKKTFDFHDWTSKKINGK